MIVIIIDNIRYALIFPFLPRLTLDQFRDETAGMDPISCIKHIHRRALEN